MSRLLLIFYISFCTFTLKRQQPPPVKPRILISTDIGGTDPDDFQSMIHFLMYSNMFHTEGLISSPSYGDGSKQDILDMINLYAQELPKLEKHARGYPSPEALRAVCKQGSKHLAPYSGYSTPTEGSDWIIKCANKNSSQPLWILAWGGLTDLAQALHDDPAIQSRIRVYWIGGPNKKWSVNSYAYIAKNFPNLWIIEDNASYRGFFSDKNAPDSLKNNNYYNKYIRGAGHLGKAFKNYYDGHIKMGDTPSLLYLMDGNRGNPVKKSWGGSFTRINYSARIIFNRMTTLADTVPVYSVVEFHFTGPVINIPSDSSCFTFNVKSETGFQKWDGYYLGNGNYTVRYAPKETKSLSYEIVSKIPGFTDKKGQLAVKNVWPGRERKSDYRLGSHWYSDRKNPELFVSEWQGAKTVLRWRSEALLDWAKRWAWFQ